MKTRPVHKIVPFIPVLALALSLPMAASYQVPVTPMDKTETIMAAASDTVSTAISPTGYWSVKAGDGVKTCVIALGQLPLEDGYGVLVERCAIAELAGASVWKSTNDGFVIVDEHDDLILKGRMTGPDGFVSLDGRYRGDRAPVA